MRRRPKSNILRDLASLIEELALMADEDETNNTPTSPTKAKASRRTRTIVRPAGESDELAAAQARRILQAHGFAEVKR